MSKTNRDILYLGVRYLGITVLLMFVAPISLYEAFKAEHSGTTKASQSRARKNIGEIKKLITDYRKASVEESK